MSYALKNPTPEQIERRRARWREYYYRHHEKHLERARVNGKAARETETPEEREARLEYARRWHAAHPDYHKTPERRAYAREWKRREAAQHPDLVRARSKRAFLRRKYGISLEEYEAMSTAQNGLCAICQQPETAVIRGSALMLAVDHDHHTGRVRALLCSRCNMTIGALGHDPVLLRTAAAYLER